MSDDRAKTPRTLLIADHIWDAFSAMAAEMGSERDALVNEALYAFARLNGFLLPVPRAAPTDSGRLRIAPAPAPTLIAEQLVAGGIPRRAPSPTARPAPAEPAMEDAPTSADLPIPKRGPPGLVLLSDGREIQRVEKDRFLIGRGKHCDLVINSGKVSREHAAILREGQGWFIEDLGSSNGTWFDAQRITRRQIQDGDEYYISSEKLSFALR
jgi:hypothetical protein